ncbi:MAG: methionine--tRNA ligase [Nitrospinae bacterium]|nr:methionine--tRNA ligase [Nitrospinota bacterium]
MRDLVVTSALPYANGSIHLGHLVEYLMTDFFVRFQKMRGGRRVLYFCADDTHGAPIMIRARNEGITPEALVARYHAEHTADFASFGVAFDDYHSTNSPENRAVAEEIYLSLKRNGNIVSREIEQTWCPKDAMFLPDRFVRGVCPKCGADDQYGDSCDKCGAHYEPTSLKEPRCALCGTAPERKSSRHLFFRVADYETALRAYMETDALQPEVKNFMATWLKDGLKEWDISRDGPYFGFRIPEEEEEKYFYVWLDAPIGYLGTAKHWAEARGQTLDSLWRNESVDIHHFIGKDITYFHTLFWIPTLTGSNYRLPARIHVHGFLTVNGEKMSKSKGTFINARDYLAHLEPEYLRYYYATKIRNSVDDVDLSLDDFLHRVNAELVNKIANLGSRTIGMLNKLDNRLGRVAAAEGAMLDEMMAAGEEIALHFDACDFNLGVQRIARLTDMANEFIDAAKPWGLKDNPDRLREVLTAGINAFRLITLYLKPVIPAFAAKVEAILKIGPLAWNDHRSLLTDHDIGPFVRLADRIEQKQLDALMEAARKAGEETPTTATPKKAEPSTPEIEFDDFAKVDLRTATVKTAARIEKADKLLHLTIDVGGEERSLVAGVAQHYTPEEMVGKTIVIVANLKPRKLRGVTSQGMLLAVNDGTTLKLVTPEANMPSGIRVS